MSAPTIRLPVAVDLPDGWRAVDPTLTGTGQSAFAAVRDTIPRDAAFTPTITMELERTAEMPDFVAVADAAAARLAAQVTELVVLDRAPIGADGPPGLTQVIWLRVPGRDGGDLDLVQSQVHLGIGVDTAGRDTLLVQLTCTAQATHTAVVAGEFEQFVASFRLRPPSTSEEGAR
ncbi:MAG TPA: hypothetical protein VGL21_11740 [Jatrophihabitantaceae bacterium]|jgi:hypothetical protein